MLNGLETAQSNGDLIVNVCYTIEIVDNNNSIISICQFQLTSCTLLLFIVSH